MNGHETNISGQKREITVGEEAMLGGDSLVNDSIYAKKVKGGRWGGG
jgi:hypothetical protein